MRKGAQCFAVFPCLAEQVAAVPTCAFICNKVGNREAPSFPLLSITDLEGGLKMFQSKLAVLTCYGLSEVPKTIFGSFCSRTGTHFVIDILFLCLVLAFCQLPIVCVCTC